MGGMEFANVTLSLRKRRNFYNVTATCSLLVAVRSAIPVYVYTATDSVATLRLHQKDIARETLFTTGMTGQLPRDSNWVEITHLYVKNAKFIATRTSVGAPASTSG